MVLGEKHGTNYLPCTPFQKFSVEIFIHGKKECLRIPDHPVCHRCPGDRHAILFPLLFLTAVGQSVTELLVHHPGNRTGRRHPIEHVCPAIFSFFDHWKILKFIFMGSDPSTIDAELSAALLIVGNRFEGQSSKSNSVGGIQIKCAANATHFSISVL